MLSIQIRKSDSIDKINGRKRKKKTEGLKGESSTAVGINCFSTLCSRRNIFQGKETCGFSVHLADDFLKKKSGGGSRLSNSETLLLSRLPCVGLDNGGTFERLVER